MADLTVEVERREECGSRPSRRLRAAGKLPAVVYGGGREAVPIQVDRTVLLRLIKEGGGENAVFLLKLAGTGKSRHTMIRKIEVNPVTRQVEHIDFQRILLDEKVRVQVPIEIEGEPTGVKNDGGVLDFVTREIEVECLPTDIPQHITVEVSHLHVGQHLEIKDIEVPPNVEVLEDPQRTLVAIAHSRVAESLAAAEEAEEEEVLLEAEREEPEVIGRGEQVESEEAPE
jgi:large subunit ribosomal protein L25